jgi:amino acid transporter
MLTGSATGISTFKGERRALRDDRIGTPGLLFSVLAATGPMMVVAGVVPTTFAAAGIAGMPLIFLILGGVLVLFSFGYAEMSRHVHNAGAFYACIARGLGGKVGFFGILGFEVSGQLAQHGHHSVDWWWPALGGVVLAGVLGALKIDLNAKTLAVLLLVETALIVVLDVSFLSDPGPQGVSVHALSPGSVTGAGFGTALCFCVVAFTGFELAPVYAEETSRPQRAVARVMFLAVGFATLLFAFTAWAITVATGPAQAVSAAQGSPTMIFDLDDARIGTTFTDILSGFFLTGTLASMLSFHNVVARYAFAMGRDGLLPAGFSRTTRSGGAPVVGSLTQSAVSVVVVTAFAVTDDKPGGDPAVAPMTRLFSWAANVGALGVVLLMALSSIAVIAFFVKRGATRVQGWRLTTSAVAAVALLATAGFAVKGFQVLVEADPGHGLRWVLPGIIALAALAGLVHGLVLRSRNPAAHARIGQGNEAFQLDKAAAAGVPSA